MQHLFRYITLQGGNQYFKLTLNSLQSINHKLLNIFKFRTVFLRTLVCNTIIVCIYCTFLQLCVNNKIVYRHKRKMSNKIIK